MEKIYLKHDDLLKGNLANILLKSTYLQNGSASRVLLFRVVDIINIDFQEGAGFSEEVFVLD